MWKGKKSLEKTPQISMAGLPLEFRCIKVAMRLMSPLPASSRSLKSVQESLALKSSDWNMARTSSSSKKVLGVSFFHSAGIEMDANSHTHRETRELWL